MQNMIPIEIITTCSYCSISPDLVNDLNQKLSSALKNITTDFDVVRILLPERGRIHILIHIPKSCAIETVKTAILQNGFDQATLVTHTKG